MKKYWRDDDEEDKKVDKMLEECAKPEQVVPTDLEKPAAPVEAAPAVEVQPNNAVVSLDALSDEELAKEVARRKTARIDVEIARAEAHLQALRNERDRLLGNPIAALDPTPVMTPLPAMTTNVNPVTGKARPAKPRPGSVPAKECTCGGEGCYLCMVMT